MYYRCILFVSCFFLFSCEKEEQPIEPYPRGAATTVSIPTGINGDYSLQIFYDLENQQVVKTVSRTSWDLGFLNQENGVRLNSSNKMLGACTFDTNFSAVLDPGDYTYNWDHPSGDSDSLLFKHAFENTSLSKYVFILDVGVNPDASIRGFKKVQLLEANSTEYVLKHADLNGANEQTVRIPKEASKNRSYLSFQEGPVDIEPISSTWDLLFTEYTEGFYYLNPPLAYLVNGVLLNTAKVKGVKLMDVSFEELELSDTLSTNLNDSLDVIGYDWKVFDQVGGLYSIIPRLGYIVKTRNNRFFKLRFIDFYDENGIKGTPKFELQELVP